MLDGMTNIKASEVLKEIKYYTEDLPPYSPDEVAEALEMAIKALDAQPCEDCISRQAVDDAIYDYSRSCDVNYEQIMEFIDKLPSVTPKYTDEEIDKAQAVEQAYVDKMVELAVEESKQKWLNSFDTSSATKCFEAVNLLKQRLEGDT